MIDGGSGDEAGTESDAAAGKINPGQEIKRRRERQRYQLNANNRGASVYHLSSNIANSWLVMQRLEVLTLLRLLIHVATLFSGGCF